MVANCFSFSGFDSLRPELFLPHPVEQKTPESKTIRTVRPGPAAVNILLRRAKQEVRAAQKALATYAHDPNLWAKYVSKLQYWFLKTY